MKSPRAGTIPVNLGLSPKSFEMLSELQKMGVVKPDHGLVKKSHIVADAIEFYYNYKKKEAE